MKTKIKNPVEEYQCVGCVGGPYPDCFVKEDGGIGCSKHCAGTSTIGGAGLQRFFLGLPRGFCRLGQQKDMTVYIFENQEQQNKQWKYDIFNIPVWKHRNEQGHILVRGYMPRINAGFIHVILDGNMDKIDCREISQDEIKEMD